VNSFTRSRGTVTSLPQTIPLDYLGIGAYLKLHPPSKSPPSNATEGTRASGFNAPYVLNTSGFVTTELLPFASIPFNPPDSISSIFGASGVVRILGLGVIGFGFFLAVFAYRLLRNLQGQPNPNRSVVRSIYVFMGFGIVLCTFGFAAQLADRRRSQELVETERELVQTKKEVSNLQRRLDDVLQSHERLSKVHGRIEKPNYGDTVLRTFPSSGTLTDFEEVAGVHIWLAVEGKGLIWPKNQALDIGKNGKWSMKVSEDGSGSEFSLSLLAADQVAHDKIEAWLRAGNVTRDRPGMDMVEGIAHLDRIDDLRLKTKP
jgi:hypothetical protein